MDNQNKYNLPIVSMDVFAQLLSQIPEGKITRVSDVLRFFEKSSLKSPCMVLSAKGFCLIIGMIAHLLTESR